MKRSVAIVTTARSEYGPSYWLIHDLLRDERFETDLVVGGSHLSARHGMTVREIEADGFPIATRIAFAAEHDDPVSHGVSAGRAWSEFAAFFAAKPRDFVALHGDRLELLPIAGAALVTGTPVVHVAGGDITEGAIDEQVRHAVTKLAHLHFTSTESARKRVLQMGEEPWRVTRSGDPALDHFVRGKRAGAAELAAELGFPPDRTTLLVTFHPTTLERDDIARQTRELVTVLREYPGTLVITAPAPDSGGEDIRRELEALAGSRPGARFVPSLGSYRYRGLLHLVGAMVGNSSSGIIEAGSVPLPVVNIGSRQQGRERGANVLDAPAEAAAIRQRIHEALAPSFRRSLQGLSNPYGEGCAASGIIEGLAGAPDRAVLLRKRFHAAGGIAPKRPVSSPPTTEAFAKQ